MDKDFSFEAKGQRWHLSPITLGDLRRFCRWVQYRPYHELQAVKDQLDATDYNTEIRDVLKQCAKTTVDVNSPAFRESLDQTAGISYLLYLSLVRNHEKLLPEQTEDLLTMKDFATVSALLLACSGMTATEEEDAEQKKTTANP